MLGRARGIADLRRAAGLTQEELAERTGLSARAISSIESGRVHRPHLRSLTAIVAALDLDAEHGEHLIRSYRRIGSTDPAPAPGPVRRADPLAFIPRQLPPRPVTLSGRGAELAAIDSYFAGSRRPGPVVISGLGGIGKTALAVEACARREADYPDGSLYAGLTLPDGSARDPAVVLGEFLFATGVDARSLPDGLAARSAMWRSVAAQRRLLVLLDDVVDERQVRPLLTPEPSTVVLAARAPLAGLDAALRLRLLPVDDRSAAEILTTNPAMRAALPAEDLAAMVRACGGLPLALRLLAARLAVYPDIPVSTVTSRLEHEDDLLGELSLGDRSVQRSVAGSVGLLGADAQRLVAELARLDVPDFGHWIFAALADSAGPTTDAIADQLLGLGLLEPASSGGGLARYRLHDLVRAALRSHAAPLDGPKLRQVIAWATHLALGVPVAGLARPVPHVLWEPRPQALTDEVRQRLLGDGNAWFAAEWHTVLRLIDLALKARLDSAAGGLLTAARIPMTWAGLLNPLLAASRRCADDPTSSELARACALAGVASVEAELGRYNEAAKAFRGVFPALDAADICTRAGAAYSFGWVCEKTGNLEVAASAYAQAVELQASVGNDYGECGASVGLAAVLAATDQDADQALAYAHRAIELADRIGDYRTMAKMAIILAATPLLDRLADPLGTRLPRYLAAAEEQGDLSMTSGCLCAIALVELHADRPRTAIQAAHRAVELLREADRPADLAAALVARARSSSALGDGGSAVEDYRAALAILDALGHQAEAGRLRATLAELTGGIEVDG